MHWEEETPHKKEKKKGRSWNTLRRRNTAQKGEENE